MCYNRIVEYDTATEKNELPMPATTQMGLEGILLSEKANLKKVYTALSQDKDGEVENRLAEARGWDGEEWPSVAVTRKCSTREVFMVTDNPSLACGGGGYTMHLCDRTVRYTHTHTQYTNTGQLRLSSADRADLCEFPGTVLPPEHPGSQGLPPQNLYTIFLGSFCSFS